MTSVLKSKGCLFLASSLCDGLEDNDIRQVTTLLLNKEANPNTLIPTYGVTPFHLVIGNDSEAFAEEVTKLFLRHGGNPNVRSVDGLTPVHVAAAWGRVTVLHLLLVNGGDPLCLDDEGRSPFHYAFDGKYYKAIVVLGKYCENVVEEEKATKHKMIFDKLLINTGDVVAEYVAPQIPEHVLDKNTFKKNKEDIHSNIKHRCSFDFSDESLNNDDLSHINAVELRVREEIDKEKCLVNEIINQLSDSLKSNTRDKEHSNKYEQSKESQYDTSPSSVLHTDDSVAYDVTHQFLLKPKIRKRSVTPRYRRKILMQNNNTNISFTPAYDPNDTIISKSPNFLTGKSVERGQRYRSPKMLNKDSKFKAFTPCMTRNESFRSEEFNLGEKMARSTPRRRKRFYRQYSSLRKLKKNNVLTSSENTSPDSVNSLSPDENNLGKLHYKFNKNLAVKLHENKYDDDVPINSSFSENKDSTDNYLSAKDVMEELNNNFKILDLKNGDSLGENKEDLKRYNTVPEKLSELITTDISNTFKENFDTLSSSLSSQSFISVQEEYKYVDSDEDIAFTERRIYTLPPCKSGKKCIPADKIWPQSLNLSLDAPLKNEVLRRKLINLGDNPGPITSTTRQVYLKRFINLENGTRNNDKKSRYNLQSSRISNTTAAFQTNRYRPELKFSLVYGDWVNHVERYKIIEKNIFKEFSNVDPSRKWRGGINKTSFTYLLLDPRITKDLPSRTNTLKKSTIWSRFLSAIFYVGKGTRNRPYSHLKDAFDGWVSNPNSDNTKLQHILEIWKDGYGIICLHVFQNVIPVEAYTREAAMIDALGVSKLKNCKRGEYYGIAATWNVQEKCNFGRYLLYQAMKIFLSEGERQIFPQNV